MRTVNVVAAAIVKDGKVFATQRGYGKYRDFWEFPGGKIEEGETPADALRREIREELDTEISVGGQVGSVEYDYPDFHLSMRCFAAAVERGELLLKEHEAARWLGPDDLDDVEWLPADLSLLPAIAAELRKNDGEKANKG
ncbi:MAG: (deoxy)nucleoside triphosphate pyrophosphohydrolase [Clostridiales bacterium]|nr:(deoxy)nucleoside triphosphate pyrophosphohydrolase [Clostridiales bacterium]